MNYSKMTGSERASAVAHLIRNGAIGYFARVEFDGGSGDYAVYTVVSEGGHKIALTPRELVESVSGHLGQDELERMVGDLGLAEYWAFCPADSGASRVLGFFTEEEAEAWARAYLEVLGRRVIVAKTVPAKPIGGRQAEEGER